VTVGYADLPRAIRSGLVLLDPTLGTPQRIIIMQFNPDTVTRSLAPQATTGESGDRSEAMRLIGPAVETWKFEADIDATDQFDTPSPDGIHPQLALLELLIHPPTDRLRTNQTLASLGTIEIAPVETPLTLWVWGGKRVLPVRLTELGITETMFDPNLNPVRATVSIGLRVLNVNDLPTGHRGGQLFLAHLAQKEQLAGTVSPARLASLGLTGL
jgi:Contractile injection system tube protein